MCSESEGILSSMLLRGNDENILMFLRVDKCYLPFDYTLHVSLIPYSVDLSLINICIHLLLNLVRFLEFSGCFFLEKFDVGMFVLFTSMLLHLGK